MPWMIPAAIVGSTLISADASSNAAGAQGAAADRAAEVQRYMFDRSNEISAPWRAAGEEQLPQIRAGLKPGGDFNRFFTLSDFEADPGYQFRMSEGTKALERSAAARGALLSGASLKGITRYTQDYASNEFQNAYNRWNTDRTSLFNRLAAVAGTGQTVSRDVSSNAMNLGTNLANTTMAAGNARASGYVGTANAVTGGVSTGINYLQGQQFLNALKPRYTLDYPMIPPIVPGQYNLDTYG